MCFIQHSHSTKMMSWVGDLLDKWELAVYSDADLEGDLETSRSTSGVFLCMRASRTFISLQGMSIAEFKLSSLMMDNLSQK